ncbi:MAG: VOC family protein [Pelagimonas sp.]|jgi:PhnB protein|nr:VOC family protein [Pelagimonas sp.]
MDMNPYLTFDGNCAEALAFYQTVLGAKPGMVMRFGDMPDQPDWVTDAIKDRIAHAQIEIGGKVIMASDTAGQEPFTGYSGFHMNLALEDLEQARHIFTRLAEGGSVHMPFDQTFWAKGFGLCTDQFGVPWMVNCE